MSLSFLESYPTVIAGIAALFGGVGVKIFEKSLNKRATEFAEAGLIREELRREIAALRVEMALRRNETDEWRKETHIWRVTYYEKVEENLKLIAEIELLKSDISSLRKKFSDKFPLDPITD